MSDTIPPNPENRVKFFAIDKEPIRAIVRDLMAVILADKETDGGVEDLITRISALTPEQQHMLRCFFDFGLGHVTQAAMRQNLPTVPWGVMVLADMLTSQAERRQKAVSDDAEGIFDDEGDNEPDLSDFRADADAEEGSA